MLGLPVIGVLALWAQTAKQSEPAINPAQQSSQTGSQTSANPLPPVQLDGSAALHHLNQIISWYRHSTTGIQTVGLPSDAIYQDNTQALVAQAVRLAFQSAKAEAALIASQQKSGGANQLSSETTQQQNLAQMLAKTSSQIDQLQSQIETLSAQMANAPVSRRGKLISQRDALQGQLELQKALLDAIQKMASFVESNGEIAGGLEGSINQLARSIPEVLGSSAGSEKKVATTTAPAKPSLANSGGLISEAMTLYDYMSAMHQLDGGRGRNRPRARGGRPVAHAASGRNASDHSAESEAFQSAALRRSSTAASGAAKFSGSYRTLQAAFRCSSSAQPGSRRP
jgi:hypothetical protein